MNQQDIKNLEKELWDPADELRGNSKLTAREYNGSPFGQVLGFTKLVLRSQNR